ncbi:GumC family protein [Niveispirillum sp. KHB5.9]|uniref:GumC family protein n=1 Tax=Niveispirillum sp. KHB5.9 TaxID=3400269 RepID=UPI003A83947B
MYATVLPHGILITICKRWRLFMAVFLGVMLMGVLYLTFATRKYESVAEMVVTFGRWSAPEVERGPATELTPSDRREIVLAHAAILHSHDLARATIETVGLANVYPDLAEDPPSSGTAMDAAVRRLQDDLSAEVGAQDNIITLSLRHPDKEMVPKLVRKLIDLYVGRQTQIYHNPHEGFLASEVRQAGDDLAKAQTTLETFKDQWRISSFDREVEDLLAQRGELDTSLHAARAALAQSQERKRGLEQLMQKVPEKVPETANGEKYRALDEAQSRLLELRMKRSQMVATYNPDGPAIAALKAGIATAEKEVAARRSELEKRSATTTNSVYQTLQTDYLRASADVEGNAQPVAILGGQIAALDQRLTELRSNRGKFDGLVREYQIKEEAYRSLSMQHANARVKGNLNDERISPAAVISEPTQPYRTVRPRGLITLLACMIGGAILATIAVLLREARDDRFTTAEQVVYLLDLPVLASFERQPHRPPLQLMALGDAK